MGYMSAEILLLMSYLDPVLYLSSSDPLENDMNLEYQIDIYL